MSASDNCKSVFIAFCVFTSMIASCSRTTNPPGEEEKERTMVLKNHIKTITEFKTTFLLGIQQPEFISSIKYFDHNGFKIKESDFKNSGIVDATITQDYDNHGNLVSIKSVGGDQSILFTEIRSYDDHNNRIELIFYLPDGNFKYKNRAIYDHENRMIQLDWYRHEGLVSTNKYSYQGFKKTEDAEYDPQGNFRYRWIYKYDEDENLIEAIQYYASGEAGSRMVYEYKDNRLARKTTYFGETIQSVFSFEYKNDLLSIKTESGANGKMTSIFRYEYEFAN